MADHVQIVTNPDAGSYKPRVIAAVRSAFEAQGAATSLSYVGPGKQLVIADDATILCVAGGDGTFRHAAKAIIESGRDVALAPYPMGTINLYHREAGYPESPEDFARTVLAGEKKAAHFPVEIGDSLFLGCASVGPDAHSVANVSNGVKRVVGRMAYGASLGGLLMRWPRIPLTLSMDGKSHACEAVYIANGSHFAGPWSFAPQARRDQAKLHVVALKDASRRRFWRFCRNVMRGRPLEDRDNLIVLTGDRLTIDSATPCPIQADGDHIGHLPVTISLRGETISVR